MTIQKISTAGEKPVFVFDFRGTITERDLELVREALDHWPKAQEATP